MTGGADCPEGSQCVNADPGYTCLCATGYTYDTDQNTCTGICDMQVFVICSHLWCSGICDVKVFVICSYS